MITDKVIVKPPLGLKSLEIDFTLSSILRLWIDWKQIGWVVPELSDDWTSGDLWPNTHPPFWQPNYSWPLNCSHSQANLLLFFLLTNQTNKTYEPVCKYINFVLQGLLKARNI